MDNRLSPAKISRPKASDTVARRRLFKLLDRARRKPLLWIMGPPGSGKTMLVADYLEHRRATMLWYQADAGDADIATFFHYLGLAAKRAAPRHRRPLPACTPDRLADPDRYARQFFTELFARLKQPFALVLDNYQDIPAEARLHETLRVALELLPDGGHIIAMSRREPPASLARVRLNNGMTIVDDSALRLTLKEAQGIARHRLPDRRLCKHVATLHALTHGWAAGLVLMLEQTSDAMPDGATSFRTPDVLFEYFAAEVFDKSDPDTRAVLLQSVFLPSMTARMVAELTGERRAGRILNHLNRNNFFTHRYDLQEAIYQYHPLFREFLRSRAVRLLASDTLAALRIRAAALLEQSGEADAALALYAEARDWVSFGACLVRLAPELVADGRTHALEQWLSTLPPDCIECSPWLLYWQACVRVNHNVRDGRLLFEKALAYFRETGDAQGVQLAWGNIVNSILQERTSFVALHDWIAAYSTLPTTLAGEIHETPIGVTMLNAMVLAQPAHPDIELWSERALTLLRSRAKANLRIGAGTYLLMRHVLAGEPSRAVPVLHLLEETLRASQIAPLVQLHAHTSIALCHWLSGAPAKALATVQDALHLAQATGVHLGDAQLCAHATAAALTAGDLDGAEDWLSRQASSINPLPTFDAGIHHFLACWLALLRADLPVAREHLTLSEKLSAGFGLLFVEANLLYARAQILLQTDKPESAVEPAKQLHTLARTHRCHVYRFMATLVDAQRALDEGQEAQALEAISQAMAIGRQQQLLNFYCWLPRVMARLCAKALEAEIETGYVRELIQRRALPPNEDARDLETWPWPVRVYTLGRLSIFSNDEALVFNGKTQSRPLELLQTLIALGGRSVPEAAVCEILWPDAEGDAAHRAFDITLHRLRRLLVSERALLLSDGKLSLNPAVCWVDTWAFERLLGRIDVLLKPAFSTSTDTRAIARLTARASSLYRGPFLGRDTNAAWAVTPRERLISKFLCLLGTLGRHWETAGDWDQAIETYQKAIDVNGLAEEHYQRLMLAYLNLGQHNEALAVYQRCRETLQATLGRPPSTNIEAIRQKLEAAIDSAL
jgi:ATP/maltotriose-dependent transcriptional regulator MalT/DNA-binding SARP family transcriptional activator